ncbi:MAG: hypothetical protein ACFFBD_21340 [Candidatus Hodarchaeota archaeon]
MDLQYTPEFAIAEVSEASLSLVVAQSYNPVQTPRFGEIVAIDTSYGLLIGAVSEIKMASSEPGRIPRKLRLSRDQIKILYGDLEDKILQLIFLWTLGFIDRANQCHHNLPPSPPLLHDLVYAVDVDFIRRFHIENTPDGRPVLNIGYVERLFAESSSILEYPLSFAKVLLAGVVAAMEPDRRQSLVTLILELYQTIKEPTISPQFMTSLANRLLGNGRQNILL